MERQMNKIIQICNQGRQMNSFQLRSMIASLANGLKYAISSINQLKNQMQIRKESDNRNKEQLNFGAKYNPEPSRNDQLLEKQNKIDKAAYQLGRRIFNPNESTQNQRASNFSSHFNRIQQAEKKPPGNMYPIRLTYVNRINQWWPPEKIAAGIGVPGYAHPTIYNYIALAFWSYSGPLDMAKAWADPLQFFGADSVFGKTKKQIQQKLKAKYMEKDIKLLVSAFGGTQFPTSANIDPIDCAQKLGNFVIQNNLDGVDVDWEDNAAMQAGKGEEWLIKFQIRLRQMLPKHIISHAPQAPYFKEQHYKNGAYVTVDRKVGNTIDFYNVQFYNQGNTTYDTYQTLFLKSGSYFAGTSVGQIIKRGVPSHKIVVGKPVTQGDAANKGLVDHKQLGKWIRKADSELNWSTGIMYWQYVSDQNGIAIENSAGYLKQKSLRRQFD